MIWCSLSLATFAGSFITLMTDTMDEKLPPNEKLELSLFAMIPLGLGQMLGGAFIGQIIDRLGMRPGILCSLTLVTLAFALMLYYVYLYEFTWLTFIVNFAWGLQDATLNNLMNCTLGFEFGQDSAAPFSV